MMAPKLKRLLEATKPAASCVKGIFIVTTERFRLICADFVEDIYRAGIIQAAIDVNHIPSSSTGP